MVPRILLLSALLLFALGCEAVPAGNPPAGFSKSISFSILEDYDKGEKLSEVEADFRLFRELGISTWRGSFGWDDYEPARHEFDLEWLHRFVELAARYGLSLRPYIAYTPEWAAAKGSRDNAIWNNPPARLNDWRHFIFHLATAMKRHANVLSFEIYNEQNSPLWWDGSRERYAQVLESGSMAVKAAKGGDQVLMGGLTYPDLAWIRGVCDRHAGGNDFDILALHAYPETWPAELPLEECLDQQSPGSFHDVVLRSVDEACGRKPLWINETGFATTPGKASERDQANWWARAIATFAADPRIEHVGIYEIKDRRKGADIIGEPENYYLGLTYSDRTRKLAFYTVKRLVHLLNNRTITVADDALSVTLVDGEKGLMYQHLFILPDGSQLLFLWSKNSSPAVDVTLPRQGTRAIEYALDGTGAAYPRLQNRTLRHVRLTPGEVRIFEIVTPHGQGAL